MLLTFKRCIKYYSFWPKPWFCLVWKLCCRWLVRGPGSGLKRSLESWEGWDILLEPSGIIIIVVIIILSLFLVYDTAKINDLWTIWLLNLYSSDCVNYLTIKPITSWTEKLTDKLKKANRYLIDNFTYLKNYINDVLYY